MPVEHLGCRWQSDKMEVGHTCALVFKTMPTVILPLKGVDEE